VHVLARRLLALQGRDDEARELFELVLGVRNDVGLLSEEYDPVRRRMVGNFPQAFSHVSVIVRAELARLASAEPGAELEDKGVSVALHTRRTPDPDAALARVREPVRALAASRGLTSFEGKLVIEVSPPGAGKGGAVQQLLRRLAPRAALYAGDDLPDIEAFDALRRTGLEVCCVAVVGSGTPERLVEIADVQVQGPLGLLELLRAM
jgi:trehalose 6-phosphate phosphatase